MAVKFVDINQIVIYSIIGLKKIKGCDESTWKV